MQPQNQRQNRGHRQDREPKEFEEKVIQVSRVSKKTKGGNKMGFSVLIVVGDKKGRVGVGLGKAKDVLSSIQKGVKKAKRRLVTVPMQGTTIPFRIDVKLGAAYLVLKPAPAGSGIIAGGPVRAVVEAAGIRDISAKILGTSNQASNVYATLEAMKQLQVLVKKKGISLRSIIEVEEEERLKLREVAEKEKQLAAEQAKLAAEEAAKAKVAEAKKPVAKKPAAKAAAPKSAPKAEEKKAEAKEVKEVKSEKVEKSAPAKKAEQAEKTEKAKK